MSLEAALGELTSGIPGCLASGVVDVRTGTVVTCKTAERGYREDFELVASSASAVFAAAPSTIMNRPWKAAAESVGDAEFREVTLLAGNRIQVFCKPENHPDLALLILCDASSNVGMILAKARLQVSVIEAELD